MRAPEFWHEPPGLLSGLLAPAGLVWQAAGRLRRTVAHPYRAPVPVICVGNLVAGGAGKTPVTMSLARLLAERGGRPHVIAHGYGARAESPMCVDPGRHEAALVGDEALLIAARAPCWVGRDRVAAARSAAMAGAGVLLLDDGFQNPRIAKDLSLLVVDADYGFGNGRVIPAGPLRERVGAGLARADAVVLLAAGSHSALALDFAGVPVLCASLDPVAAERFADMPVFAFAGIGRPEKFFATLRAIGAQLAGTQPFPDHHPYRVDEIAKLRQAACRRGARLVTTAKDAMRLSAELRAGIEVLEVEIRWRAPAMLARLLTPFLQPAGGDGHAEARTPP